MSENIPSLPGALPPKPAESAKVQPKKETVRINLPPKPTAAPTIKLPTLPTGAPPSAATAAPVAASAAPMASAAPAAPKPAAPAPPTPPPTAASRVAGGSPNRTGAPPSGAHATPVAPANRKASGPMLVSGLDKGLAVFAAVVCVAAVGIAVYLAFFLTNSPQSGT